MTGQPQFNAAVVPDDATTPGADPADGHKQLYRSLAAGVAVVTTDGPYGPAGMTVSSIMAVSLTPPLLLVSLAKASGTLAALRESGRFAVNLLGDGQQAIAARFATGRPAWVKFAGVRLVDSGTGPPVIDRVLAAATCEVVWVRPAGDHTLVLGQITEVAHGAGRPLVWHASGYHGVHPTLAR